MIFQRNKAGFVGQYENVLYTYSAQVTRENSVEEILENIMAFFNNKIASDFLKYDYNSETHQLRIWSESKDVRSDTNYVHGFLFSIDGGNRTRFENLARFLNFPESQLPYLIVLRSEFIFDNVWDRKILHVHSSIANTTPHNYLGHEGEFYPTLSKFYKWTSKSKIFRVWTSFDRKTPVKLWYQPFLIQLQLSASCHR